MRDIRDDYVNRYPTKQNIVDLFENEWSSVFPAEFGLKSVPGTAPLFEDARINWIDKISEGLRGKTIVELGPLEGGHTYLMEKLGASRIVAIEANKRAFLKCLCVKEIMNLKVSRFLLGDFNSFLEKNQEPFDIAVACGVLYHMREPLSLIDSLCANAREGIFLWSHYFDAQVVTQLQSLKKRFDLNPEAKAGVDHYRYYYQDALTWDGFCGGGYEYSHWLTLQSIKNRFIHNGFSNIIEHFHQQDHPHGPAIALYCQRT